MAVGYLKVAAGDVGAVLETSARGVRCQWEDLNGEQVQLCFCPML